MRSGAAADRSCSRPAARDLRGASIVVPGERTTAYLLFRLWAADQGVGEISVLPFPQIMPAVRDGRFDAGLVIHEARFTYADYGLTNVVDLGAWWEADTGLPIPLGAIIARRCLDVDVLARCRTGVCRTRLRQPLGVRLICCCSMRARWIPTFRRATSPCTSTNSRSILVTRATPRSRRCSAGPLLRDSYRRRPSSTPLSPELLVEVVRYDAQHGRDLVAGRLVGVAVTPQAVGDPVEQLDQVFDDDDHLVGLLPLRLGL